MLNSNSFRLYVHILNAFLKWFLFRKSKHRWGELIMMYFLAFPSTGLDPAKPLIENHAGKSFRLTKDDAHFVQIIHTNAGFLGQSLLTGHIDFCVNGGRLQPYCTGGHPVRKSAKSNLNCVTIHSCWSPSDSQVERVAVIFLAFVIWQTLYSPTPKP